MAKYCIQKPIEPDNMTARAKLHFDTFRYRYLLQPKYDGCACAVIVYPAVWAKPPKVLSSTGEIVPMSMERAAEELRVNFGPQLTAPAVFIGEAWSPNMEFKDISGAFRRQKEVSGLLLAVHDVVEIDENGQFYSHDTYEQRYAYLALLFGRALSTGCVLKAPVFPIQGNDPDGYAKQLQLLGGYDGAMMKDSQGLYEPERVKMAEAVKVKPLVELDLLCTGFEAAVGAKTGRKTVALLIRMKDGVIGKVATGLSEDEQANPEQFVGKILAVEALGFYGTGLLREPRVKGIRHDKLEPDF